MKIVERLKSWYEKHRRKPLSELVTVECSDLGVRVTASDEMDPGFNQTFQWSDISRVCFKDEGIYRSDIIFIKVRGRKEPYFVLIESNGGNEFFSQLVGRGLFPAPLATKAMQSSNGGLYCWPDGPDFAV